MIGGLRDWGPGLNPSFFEGGGHGGQRTAEQPISAEVVAEYHNNKGKNGLDLKGLRVRVPQLVPSKNCPTQRSQGAKEDSWPFFAP